MNKIITLRSAMTLGTLALLGFVGATADAQVTLSDAAAPNNLAQFGTPSVYTFTGGGLATPLSGANDTLISGDQSNNLLTITGDQLGIQIDLTGPSNLTELSAYVDPASNTSDPFKNTDSVEFFTSADGGLTFSDQGAGTFGAEQTLDSGHFSYVNVTGNYSGVTNVRYLFHQADGGNEGQRIGEVLAIGPAATPEPGSMALLVGMTTVGAGVLRRRRK